MVLAISRRSPLPEALSFALGFGWQRCAIRKISWFGLVLPLIVAVMMSSLPGKSLASTMAFNVTFFFCLSNARSWLPWRLVIENPKVTLFSSLFVGHIA